jgi:hypothetical protein
MIEMSATNRDEVLADALYRSPKKAATSPSNALHIHYAYSISLGFNKERYYLIMVVDGMDFIRGFCLHLPHKIAQLQKT